MRKGKSNGSPNLCIERGRESPDDANLVGSYDDWSNEMLMNAYAQGDGVAFGVLYGRTSAKVYGYLNRRLKDRSVVDDVFQGTYLKLHDHRSMYDSKFPFEPWLFTICRSVLIDVCRKRGRSLEDLHSDAADSELIAAPIAEVTASGGLPDLKGLPEHQRRAIELRYLEELSFDEIAARLETSPANVRQMISSAVKRLRLLFQKTGESL